MTALAAGLGVGSAPQLLAYSEHSAADEFPALETFAGKPRDRGRSYGAKHRDAIQEFLANELYGAFIPGSASREELLRYAGACAGAVREYSAALGDELEGIAEGAAIDLEEIVLITLHEELYHRGALPKVPHCTAVAVGPPRTESGQTLVGQTWDWMPSVYGLSRVLYWQRAEGPSVLAYGFPGMFCGAGLNSAGLALCWTSAALGDQTLGVRVGIPSYVLITHLLYQQSLDDVISEARRATNAGWFTFVMGDSAGRLLNIEGSPEKIAIEPAQGLLARVSYGSREMTRAPDGKTVMPHERCRKACQHLEGEMGHINLERMQCLFQEPANEISQGKATIDMMVYDTMQRTAWLSRGPSYRLSWKKFEFPA